MSCMTFKPNAWKKPGYPELAGNIIELFFLNQAGARAPTMWAPFWMIANRSREQP